MNAAVGMFGRALAVLVVAGIASADEGRPTADLVLALKDRGCEGTWSPEAVALAARGADVARALVGALAEPDGIRCNAARILVVIGPPAVPAVVAALGDAAHPAVQGEALAVLERMGAAGRGAQPAVIAALDDERLQFHACRALESIGGDAQKAVATVEKLVARGDVRDCAFALLARAGTESRDVLARALASPDADVRRRAALALVKLGCGGHPELFSGAVNAIGDPDPHVRRMVIAAMEGCREKAGPAVPALVHALDDSDRAVRLEAARTLGYVSQAAVAAVPALAAALHGDDPELRLRVAEALGFIRAAARTSPLVDALAHDPDARVRAAAAGSLHSVPEAVPALVGALTDPDAAVRGKAMFALGPADDDDTRLAVTEAVRASVEALRAREDPAEASVLLWAGPRAVPVLRDALADGDPAVRSRVADALGQVLDDRPWVRGEVLLALSDPRPSVRVGVANAFGRALALCGEQAGRAGDWTCPPEQYFALDDRTIAAVSAALHDESPAVRQLAASALAAASPDETPAAVADLAAALRDPAPDVRAQAAYGLGAQKGHSPEIVARLLATLRELERASEPAFDQLGEEIVRALAKRGAEAKPALPTLVDIVRKGQGLDGAAAEAIAQIGPGPDVVGALATAFETGSPGVRIPLAAAMLGMGPAAEPAVPALVRALRDDDESVRFAAATALAAVSPATTDGVPVLTAKLADGTWPGRLEAATALGEIGPAAAAAVPALVEALRDGDTTLRDEAVRALERIGTEPARAAVDGYRHGQAGDGRSE